MRYDKNRRKRTRGRYETIMCRRRFNEIRSKDFNIF